MRETVSAVIKPSLQELFNTAWTRGRVLLFSAPCGSGKTTTARALLAPFRCHWLNGQTLSFSDLQPDSLPDKSDAVVVDDLQYLVDSERQHALCELIRARTDLRFVLLGRNPLPGWLMPFQFAGLLHVARTADLHFDLATTQALLDALTNGGRGVARVFPALCPGYGRGRAGALASQLRAAGAGLRGPVEPRVAAIVLGV